MTDRVAFVAQAVVDLGLLVPATSYVATQPSFASTQEAVKAWGDPEVVAERARLSAASGGASSSACIAAGVDGHAGGDLQLPDGVQPTQAPLVGVPQLFSPASMAHLASQYARRHVSDGTSGTGGAGGSTSDNGEAAIAVPFGAAQQAPLAALGSGSSGAANCVAFAAHLPSAQAGPCPFPGLVSDSDVASLAASLTPLLQEPFQARLGEAEERALLASLLQHVLAVIDRVDSAALEHAGGLAALLRSSSALSASSSALAGGGKAAAASGATTAVGLASTSAHGANPRSIDDCELMVDSEDEVKDQDMGQSNKGGKPGPDFSLPMAPSNAVEAAGVEEARRAEGTAAAGFSLLVVPSPPPPQRQAVDPVALAAANAYLHRLADTRARASFALLQGDAHTTALLRNVQLLFAARLQEMRQQHFAAEAAVEAALAQGAISVAAYSARTKDIRARSAAAAASLQSGVRHEVGALLLSLPKPPSLPPTPKLVGTPVLVSPRPSRGADMGAIVTPGMVTPGTTDAAAQLRLARIVMERASVPPSLSASNADSEAAPAPLPAQSPAARPLPSSTIVGGGR